MSIKGAIKDEVVRVLAFAEQRMNSLEIYHAGAFTNIASLRSCLAQYSRTNNSPIKRDLRGREIYYWLDPKVKKAILASTPKPKPKPTTDAPKVQPYLGLFPFEILHLQRGRK